MRFTSSLLALGSLATCVFAQDSDISTVVSRFTQAKIPSDIGIPFNPSYLMSATYDFNDWSSFLFQSGSSIKASEMFASPHFDFYGAGEDAYAGPYVVAIVDLDGGASGQVRRFLASDYVYNWRTGALETAFDGTPGGAPIKYYTNWTQPASTSRAHRFVFLAFKQSPTFNEQRLVTSNTPTANWSLSSFANATGLAQPVAGLFGLVS
ncbi:hypothetical protein DFP72DRAFT_924006 [Ephemerocybe angulata]|uniref:PEBP-like protein n=1 Tax=Ephemerocybe angulata TaxID=980116 RepID=A0A8H6LW20_9AGAR|nr:hypothetical protein DFP72DRAFT_924006 [Tulosesus angulatus]